MTKSPRSRSNRKKKRKQPQIELNTEWFLFFGRQLHMGRQEILATRYGEMLDMIACLAIQNGAKPKKKRKRLRYEDAIELR